MECPLPFIETPRQIAEEKLCEVKMASTYIKKSKRVFMFLHLLLESERDVTRCKIPRHEIPLILK
jgi:hypothetical protein